MAAPTALPPDVQTAYNDWQNAITNVTNLQTELDEIKTYFSFYDTINDYREAASKCKFSGEPTVTICKAVIWVKTNVTAIVGRDNTIESDYQKVSTSFKTAIENKETQIDDAKNIVVSQQQLYNNIAKANGISPVLNSGFNSNTMYIVGGIVATIIVLILIFKTFTK